MARSRRTRRDFLKTSAAAGGLTLLSPEEVLAVMVGGIAVRQNVNTLGPTSPDIVAYKKGINAMKALPATNPLNWNAWANIHGIGPAPPPAAGGPAQWNTCQHGSWWFLPWHRMYLIYFERIIRKLSATPSFSLPFWDYTAGTAAGNVYPARALPRIFRTPTTGNALFATPRGAGINAGGQIAASSVSTTTAMNTLNFSGPAGSSNSFGSQSLAAPNHGAVPHGRLESSPHDSVHGALGGLMGSFGTAARDPIFWLHHCNIDRLWNRWLTLGGGRRDPSNPAWCNQVFRFFNENGAAVNIRVSDVINAQAQLQYRYAGEPPQVLQRCPPGLAAPIINLNLTAKSLLAQDRPLTVGATPLTVPVKVTAQKTRMKGIAADAAKTLVLRIEGIKISAQPGIIYEVYVGLPAGQKPDPESPHFVGVLSTFGAEHAGAEGLTAAFPIDAAAARALAGAGDDLPVTIVPKGVVLNGQEQAPQPQGNVTFTRVRVLEE